MLWGRIGRLRKCRTEPRVCERAKGEALAEKVAAVEGWVHGGYLEPEFPASFEGASHRDFVGVLDVRTCRDACSDARDAQAGVLPVQFVGKMARGGFTFDGGAGGKDYFLGIFQTRPQVDDTQLILTDSVHRRKRSVQYVVDTVVGAGFFNCINVGGFFHNADGAGAAGGVGAVAAGVNVRDVVADRAEMERGAKSADGVGEGRGKSASAERRM